jgi:hypothetical protein
MAWVLATRAAKAESEFPSTRYRSRLKWPSLAAPATRQCTRLSQNNKIKQAPYKAISREGGKKHVGGIFECARGEVRCERRTRSNVCVTKKEFSNDAGVTAQRCYKVVAPLPTQNTRQQHKTHERKRERKITQCATRYCLVAVGTTHFPTPFESVGLLCRETHGQKKEVRSVLATHKVVCVLVVCV